MKDNWIRGKTLTEDLRAYLIHEDEPENPRTGGMGREALGTTVMFGEHAGLGDETHPDGPVPFLMQAFAELVPDVAGATGCDTVPEMTEDLRRALRQAQYPGLFLELDCMRGERYQFDAGKFGARWVEGRQAGYYYVSDARLAERGLNRMEGAAVMLAELAQYEEYLNGKVFRLQLEQSGTLVCERRNVLNTHFSLGRAERLNRWPDDAALDALLNIMLDASGMPVAAGNGGWYSPMAGAPMVPIAEPLAHEFPDGPGHDHYHYQQEYYGMQVVQSFIDNWELALTKWNGANLILGHDDPDCQRC